MIVTAHETLRGQRVLRVARNCEVRNRCGGGKTGLRNRPERPENFVREKAKKEVFKLLPQL